MIGPKRRQHPKETQRERSRSWAGAVPHTYAQKFSQGFCRCSQNPLRQQSRELLLYLPSINPLFLDFREMGTSKTLLQLLCQVWGSRGSENILQTIQARSSGMALV